MPIVLSSHPRNVRHFPMLSTLYVVSLLFYWHGVKNILRSMSGSSTTQPIKSAEMKKKYLYFFHFYSTLPVVLSSHPRNVRHFPMLSTLYVVSLLFYWHGVKNILRSMSGSSTTQPVKSAEMKEKYLYFFHFYSMLKC